MLFRRCSRENYPRKTIPFENNFWGEALSAQRCELFTGAEKNPKRSKLIQEHTRAYNGINRSSAANLRNFRLDKMNRKRHEVCV